MAERMKPMGMDRALSSKVCDISASYFSVLFCKFLWVLKHVSNEAFSNTNLKWAVTTVRVVGV